VSPAADLVAGARAAVRAAGAIAMAQFGTAHRRWEKGPGQVVTEADLAVDALLAARLRPLEPAAAWLSEESVDDGGRLAAERVWVVDPIDGTRSFAEGVPEFTICVGLVERGRPILGLVLNPATDELFEAALGGPALLNGRPVAVAGRAGLAEARIVVSRTEQRRRRFDALLPAAEITTIGSLAYKLCLVAAGRFDGYVTWRRCHDWDIAGAMAVLAAAGAVVSERDGAPIGLNRPEPRHAGLVAAAPALHDAILAATRAHLAEALPR
jgi:myo-inositol-1(or 4)-monophosphatase